MEFLWLSHSDEVTSCFNISHKVCVIWKHTNSMFRAVQRFYGLVLTYIPVYTSYCSSITTGASINLNVVEKFIYFSNSTQKCTQTEVVQVFGYFNCDGFGSHLTKTHQIRINKSQHLNKWEYFIRPI